MNAAHLTEYLNAAVSFLRVSWMERGQCDLPPFYGSGAMLGNSDFRQQMEPRFEGRAAARRGSNAA